jgi:EAL domain-containing protein (putative c-di-GMP-specific phosphodiesterase class I)
MNDLPDDVVTGTAGVKRGRILIVDDEESLRRVIGRMLTADGYDVAMAADGEAAAQALVDGSFDVVLSDIDMPRMTGVQLLETVRQRDQDVPVVLMTGNPDLRTALQAVAHGALQYLIKPINSQELKALMERAVRLNKMAKLKRDALILVSEGGLGIADRLALEASFERALDTLWMAYQPIIRTADRSLFGYEALLRSEEKALPHPGAVLDAAERLGRLHDLGRRIRTAACAPIAGAPDGAVLFVNLHSHDLMDASLLATDSPLSGVASRVVLEITERASLDHVKDVRARIATLRQNGFRIAIDDLGAGYAGLTSFATLEPEFVKLDMALVRDVHRIPTKEKLLRSMTTLCKELGIKVVAEGVETREECEVLVSAGCDFLQGYLFAKPGRPFPTFKW